MVGAVVGRREVGEWGGGMIVHCLCCHGRRFLKKTTVGLEVNKTSYHE